MVTIAHVSLKLICSIPLLTMTSLAWYSLVLHTLTSISGFRCLGDDTVRSSDDRKRA